MGDSKYILHAKTKTTLIPKDLNLIHFIAQKSWALFISKPSKQQNDTQGFHKTSLVLYKAKYSHSIYTYYICVGSYNIP